MKNILRNISALFAVFFAFGASAADYAYVSATSAQFRAEPSAAAKVLAEFDKFEVVRLLDAGQNGWSRVQASLYDAESFEEKGVTGFVRSDQLTLLADDPVPEELFSRNFTYTRQGSDLRSSLELNRDADGATFDYAIYSKNRKTAASRMIDFSEGRLTYIDGHLGAYLSQPTIYDSSRHLLYLAGMLWHAE